MIGCLVLFGLGKVITTLSFNIAVTIEDPKLGMIAASSFQLGGTTVICSCHYLPLVTVSSSKYGNIYIQLDSCVVWGVELETEVHVFTITEEAPTKLIDSLNVKALVTVFALAVMEYAVDISKFGKIPIIL